MSEDCYEPPTTTLPRGLNLPRHSTLCRITIGYRTRWADLQLSRLLPVLDRTPMGWKQRDWLLGIDQRQLFGRAGNIGPALRRMHNRLEAPPSPPLLARRSSGRSATHDLATCRTACTT